jgi:acetylornithine deacetylase
MSRWLASCEHPVLGRATVNLGNIAGGGELNIVPARCSIGLDFRTHPACTGAAILARLRAAISAHARKASMDIVCNRPSFVADRGGEWPKRLRREGGGWARADWFCDANMFNAYGIPAVAFGPGKIEQAHTKDEFISEGDLNAGARSFLGILQSTRA